MKYLRQPTGSSWGENSENSFVCACKLAVHKQAPHASAHVVPSGWREGLRGCCDVNKVMICGEDCQVCPCCPMTHRAFDGPVRPSVNGCGPGNAGQEELGELNHSFSCLRAACKWHQQDDCISCNFAVSGRKRKEAKKAERERGKHCLQQSGFCVCGRVCVCVSLLVTVCFLLLTKHAESEKWLSCEGEGGEGGEKKWKWRAWVSDGEGRGGWEKESERTRKPAEGGEESERGEERERGRERAERLSISQQKEESTPCSDWMSSFPPPHAHPSIHAELLRGGYDPAARRSGWDIALEDRGCGFTREILLSDGR